VKGDRPGIEAFLVEPFSLDREGGMRKQGLAKPRSQPLSLSTLTGASKRRAP